MILKLLMYVLILAAIKPTHSPNLRFITNLRWRHTYALNRFAIDFYHYMPTRHQENIFLSPLSITNALSAVYYGSGGETEKELRDVLFYDMANITKRGLSRVANMFSPRFILGDDTEFYVFNTSNAILINPKSNLSMIADFQSEMAERFSVAMMTVDFYDLYPLNQWVLSQTRKIRFYEKDINSSVDLMVISTAYLKAAWEYEFSSLDTKEKTFYNRGIRSGAKKVPMMHMKNELNFYTDDHFLKILELPFKDRVLRMFIFLPIKYNELFELESKFTYIFLTELRKLKVHNVSVSLPMFELRYSTSMIPSITNMGAAKLFDPESVNLSGMTEDQEVVVGGMVHKTFLSVTEGGLDIAATSFAKVKKSYKHVVPFKANHPFFFVITDRRPRILFVGRVNEL